MPSANVVGPLIKRARQAKKPPWTQDKLASELQLAGWDIDRFGISKIERQVRCVTDKELLLLAQALQVPPAELLPSESAS
ncbi:MAG: helix-turn-helix domain-containing protein [Chloroflexi bacterium]|nr:helix-turn-helix domain-containing protein [Chloroflexota bacterium]